MGKHNDEYDIDDVLPGKKKKSHLDILDELRSIEDTVPDTVSTSISSFLPEPKKDDTPEFSNTAYDPDAWFNELMGKRSANIGEDLMGIFLVPVRKRRKRKKIRMI